MTHEQQFEALKSKFGGAIVKVEFDRVNCPIVWVAKKDIANVLKFVRDAEGFEFQFMADLTAYDDQGSPEAESTGGRFVVVYNLFSPQSKTRFRFKTRVADGEAVPTATTVWEAANWAEREVYDMFGVKFEGHPDLRRILMDVRWEGHPLRKEYPLRKYQLFNDPEQIPVELLEPKKD